jgi:hypothetical protein
MMDDGDGDVDDFDGRVVGLLVVATAELLLSGMLLVSSLFAVAAAAATVLNEVGQRGELQHLPLFARREVMRLHAGRLPLKTQVLC